MRRRRVDLIETVLAALTLIGLPLAAAAILVRAARGSRNNRKAR
jgi:hypothetical protein